MNKRLMFLKYGAGEYLKPHCDGSEWSLLTSRRYLGKSLGGATRFFGGNWDQEVEVEVEPVQGRVLVFQHQWLVRSGGGND
ncbi:hypothetical protein K440DRAFT_195100 [Wilcoxina mikolae CBS 423.85]|nr:hypothetical protein K440DRAFT_195100 [Wilcoxina mikolae CBS 423.85]